MLRDSRLQPPDTERRYFHEIRLIRKRLNLQHIWTHRHVNYLKDWKRCYRTKKLHMVFEPQFFPL